jgi:LysR family glycine cleavage system transcriptional activator/LysR family transcriptional regulator of beta-lactamase
MVRLLEDRLGYGLFQRKPNRLELTSQGRTLLGGLTDSFDAMARLVDQVAAMRAGPVLTVGVGPTLAINWLIPRLAEFYRKRPDIEVRMATGGATRPVRDDWTCTIRRDTKAWPGYIAEELFPSTLVPVCTPMLAGALRAPEDLRKSTLIFVSHMTNDWPCWFDAAGLHRRIRPSGELSFDSNAMAMRAALDGAGVAIAQPIYVTDALAAGRLVAPFPIVARKSEAWYLEYRPHRKEDPALLVFRKWLSGEIERQREAETRLLNRPVSPGLMKLSRSPRAVPTD